jgi:hypothetical protein
MANSTVDDDSSMVAKSVRSVSTDVRASSGAGSSKSTHAWWPPL